MGAETSEIHDALECRLALSPRRKGGGVSDNRSLNEQMHRTANDPSGQSDSERQDGPLTFAINRLRSGHKRIVLSTIERLQTTDRPR